MTTEKYKSLPEIDRQANIEENYHLILINDDIHTFEYVIDALMEICHHTEIQATQCTMLVHFKGSCDIKNGTFKDLKPLRKALIEKELNATINH